MEGRLFTLVNAEDDSQVFAWGMEITGEDEQEAIIYRRDPVSRHSVVGTHASAEAALRRYRKVAPMALVWEDCCEKPELALH